MVSKFETFEIVASMSLKDARKDTAQGWDDQAMSKD